MANDKLREVAELIADLDMKVVLDGHYDELADIISKAKEALKEPPFNYEGFDNLNDAQRYYVNHGCESGLGMIVDSEIKKVPWKSNFEKWLFKKKDMSIPAKKKEDPIPKKQPPKETDELPFKNAREAFRYWWKNVSTCDDNKAENEEFNEWFFTKMINKDKI